MLTRQILLILLLQLPTNALTTELDNAMAFYHETQLALNVLQSKADLIVTAKSLEQAILRLKNKNDDGYLYKTFNRALCFIAGYCTELPKHEFDDIKREIILGKSSYRGADFYRQACDGYEIIEQFINQIRDCSGNPLNKTKYCLFYILTLIYLPQMTKPEVIKFLPDGQYHTPGMGLKDVNWKPHAQEVYQQRLLPSFELYNLCCHLLPTLFPGVSGDLTPLTQRQYFDLINPKSALARMILEAAATSGKIPLSGSRPPTPDSGGPAAGAEALLGLRTGSTVGSRTSSRESGVPGTSARRSARPTLPLAAAAPTTGPLSSSGSMTSTRTNSKNPAPPGLTSPGTSLSSGAGALSGTDSMDSRAPTENPPTG